MSVETIVECSWTGYHRGHGEISVLIDTHVELSAGSLCMDKEPSQLRWIRSANGSVCAMADLVHRVIRCVIREFRGAEDQSCQGYKLSTYHITGLSGEHGNLEPSAGSETAGQPPSPVASRSGGGAFVVVGVRESRIQGEGRQSMSAVARPLG
jgi:hypothetical protein